MRAVLGSQSARVDLEGLRTVFAEVTSILNSRPICSFSDAPNAMELLTPNHLLLQRRKPLCTSRSVSQRGRVLALTMEARPIHRQLLLVSMGPRIRSDVSASPEMAAKEAELTGERPGSYRG